VIDEPERLKVKAMTPIRTIVKTNSTWRAGKKRRKRKS